MNRLCLLAKAILMLSLGIPCGIASAQETIGPENTSYLQGKKDSTGLPITSSAPVKLGPLNETPKLKDNDYTLTPQKAFNVINYERFPAFRLNPKFIIVWNTRRFTDEDKFGGPLNRGFSHMTTIIDKQDDLRLDQRWFFEYPGILDNISKELAAKDKEKYRDLLGWSQLRSAWVSPANAQELGRRCYEAVARGGSNDFGFYSFDEEEMWYTRGEGIFKDHPELLPEDLKKLRETDPKAEKPGTVAAIHKSYNDAWASFLGNYYKGAVDCAAARGRKLVIYHYGSLWIGLNSCWGEPPAIDPKTGMSASEKVGSLYDWYRKDGQVSFDNNLYVQLVKYFHKDSYYFLVYPQTLSIYQRGQDGKYILDDKGRRKIRTDVAEDPVYAAPTKIGYEDYAGGAANMKEFIAKGENSLFWFNGGKYYKRSGTLVTDKRPLVTMRPGNQETMGDAAKLGSRPVSPYMVEAAVIYNFMIGQEGFYLWHNRYFATPAGQPAAKPPFDKPETFGELEFFVKGLHRLSQFNALFDGTYSFIRPVRHEDIRNRDHPVIRGIINGRYLLLAMSNPYLDLDEKQQVEIWYDADEKAKGKIWTDTVTIQPRKVHLFQCKLPALPQGEYDPDRLYFRYTCVDGTYTKTFTVTGNYEVPYRLGEGGVSAKMDK
ncbi:MAG: hypothetical protein ACM359_15045 [Bacillota bacterium]